jgi:hypothetical protein
MGVSPMSSIPIPMYIGIGISAVTWENTGETPVILTARMAVLR